MFGQKRIPLLILLLGTSISQFGCVALNIPSHRFHDPADHGGVLGAWRIGDSHDSTEVHGPIGPPAAFSGSEEVSGFCLDGGPLEVDPFDPSLDVNGVPKKPEVPWPRFHPVPTRPIFGAAAH